MTDKPKLTLKKPLSLQKQTQLFQALKPLHEQAKKEKRRQEKEQAQKEREARQKKREEIKRTLAWLYEKFPACFNLKVPKPLKLDIHHDIYSAFDKENAPSKGHLRDALTYYTRNLHYLKSIVKGTHRYGLEGNAVQEITEEQKTYAQEKLDRVLNAIKSKKQYKTPKPPQETNR